MSYRNRESVCVGGACVGECVDSCVDACVL